MASKQSFGDGVPKLELGNEGRRGGGPGEISMEMLKAAGNAVKLRRHKSVLLYSCSELARP